ncbi:MAG TPA: hypothetical protein VK934_10495 [Fimbriimonas sp.]|nr:hypothetical protein [Fimbriimonas sp.]
MKHFHRLLFLLVLALTAFGCGGDDGVPIPPNPTWAITPAGGTLTALGGKVKLVVPPGAVATSSSVTVTPLSSPNPPLGQAAVAGTAASYTHLAFTVPATLTLSFDGAGLTAEQAAAVKIFRRGDGSNTWNAVTTTVDAGAKTASASINGFSSYALFYPVTDGLTWDWTSAGGDFVFEGLSVHVPGEAVAPGETVQVQPRITPSPFAPPSGFTAVAGASFDLGSSDPDFTAISAPLNFTIQIPSGVPSARVEQISMFWKENATSDWVRLNAHATPTTVGTGSNSKLGTFALFYATTPGWTWRDVEGHTFVFEGLTVVQPAHVMPLDFDVAASATTGSIVPPSGWTAIPNNSFDIRPTTSTTTETANAFSVRLNYTLASVPEAQRSHVGIFWRAYAGSSWSALTTTPDPVLGSGTVSSHSMGTYAIFYPETAASGILFLTQEGQQNDSFLNVYAASSESAQQLRFSYLTSHDRRVEPMSYRPYDNTFLAGRILTDGSKSFIDRIDVATTNVTTPYTIFPSSGMKMLRVYPMTGRDGTQHVATVASEITTTVGQANGRDRLFVYHGTSTTPVVLGTKTRTNMFSDPESYRIEDVSPDGKVLVRTETDLVLYDGTGSPPVVLAVANSSSCRGSFSPSGNLILNVHDFGWNVINLSGVEQFTVPSEVKSFQQAAWGRDDTHVLARLSSPSRAVTIDLTTSGVQEIAPITTSGFFHNIYPDMPVRSRR